MRWVLGLLMLPLLLATVDASAAEPVSLTYMAYTSSTDATITYLNEKAAAYEALHPNVDVQIIVGNQEQLQVLMAGGVPPDIFDMPDFDHLGPAGYFVDIRPLLDRDGLTQAFNPVMLDWLSEESGALYTVPAYVWSAVTFFNRERFQLSGLTTPDQLGGAWNWDSLLDMGKRLTIDSDGDGTPETWGIDRGYAYWRRAVAAAGGQFYEFDEMGRPVRSLWNSEPVVRGLEYNARLWAEGTIPYMRVPDQARFFFWTGGTAIDVVDHTGIMGYLQDATFDWAMTLLPAGPTGLVASAGSGVGGPNIFASSDNVDQTWDFAKFLFIDEESFEGFVRNVGLIPAAQVGQNIYASIVGGGENRNYDAIFDALNYLPPRVTSALTPDLSERSVNVNELILGNVPIRPFLEQVHQRMQAIIDSELHGDM